MFEFTWGDDLLRWELRPEGGGCVLVFTHTFDDRAGAASPPRVGDPDGLPPVETTDLLSPALWS